MNAKLEIEILCDVVSELFDDLDQQHRDHVHHIDTIMKRHADEIFALQEAKKKADLGILEWKLRADEKTAQYNYWRNLAIKLGNLDEYAVVRYAMDETKQRQL